MDKQLFLLVLSHNQFTKSIISRYKQPVSPKHRAIPFKYDEIIQVEWIISNHYQEGLLSYKLKNHFESLYFTETSITLLLRFCTLEQIDLVYQRKPYLFLDIKQCLLASINSKCAVPLDLFNYILDKHSITLESLQNKHPTTQKEITFNALKYGVITIIKILPFNWFQPDSLDIAASFGHLSIVKYLHEHYPFMKIQRETLFSFVNQGHLDLLKYVDVNKIGCQQYGSVLKFAFLSSHLDIFKYIIAQENKEMDMNLYPTRGLQFPSLEIIEYAFENVPNFAPEWWYITAFIHYGMVDRVKKFLTETSEPAYRLLDATNIALSRGHLLILEYLFNYHPTILPNGEGIVTAAKNYHTEALKYAIKNYTTIDRLDKMAIYQIIEAENFEMASYLLDIYKDKYNVQYIDVLTAIKYSKLELCKKMVESMSNKRYYQSWTSMCISNGNLEIMMYLHSVFTEDFAQERIINQIVKESIANNQLQLLQDMKSNGIIKLNMLHYLVTLEFQFSDITNWIAAQIEITEDKIQEYDKQYWSDLFRHQLYRNLQILYPSVFHNIISQPNSLNACLKYSILNNNLPLFELVFNYAQKNQLKLNKYSLLETATKKDVFLSFLNKI